MTDFSHLDAIQHRLREAKARRDAQEEGSKGHEFFAHQVRMIEREEIGEYKFLGIDPATIPASLDDISDDDLLRELGE